MPYKDKEVEKAWKKNYNKEYKSAYYEKNKEKVLAQGRSYYEQNGDKMRARQKQKYRDNPAQYLFYAARHRAKKFGLEFTIEPSDIVIPERCPIFGTAFVVGDKDLAPSVDRVDVSKGYVKGNVAVISFRANRIKNNSTVEHMKRFIEYIEGYKMNTQGFNSTRPTNPPA